MLANYVIKQLKSTYLFPSMRVAGLNQTQWNEITELVGITIVLGQLR